MVGTSGMLLGLLNLGAKRLDRHALRAQLLDEALGKRTSSPNGWRPPPGVRSPVQRLARSRRAERAV